MDPLKLKVAHVVEHMNDHDWGLLNALNILWWYVSVQEVDWEGRFSITAKRITDTLRRVSSASTLLSQAHNLHLSFTILHQLTSHLAPRSPH